MSSAPATEADDGHRSAALVLAIDTTGERCSAALLDMPRAAILSRADPVIGRGHAERLMHILAGILGDAGRTYADLGRVAVGVGPGSFTGIRVGVSVARGLSLALTIPAVGVDALTALAEPHLRRDRLVLCAQDARRGEVYAALFAPDGRCLREPHAIPADGFVDFVAQVAGSSDILLVGSAAQMASDQLGGRHRVEIADASGVADIASIARIGAALPADRIARPLYLRSADAKPQAPSGFSFPRPVPIRRRS